MGSVDDFQVFLRKVVMGFFLDMKGYNQIQSPEKIEIKSKNENKERKTKTKNKERKRRKSIG